MSVGRRSGRWNSDGPGNGDRVSGGGIAVTRKIAFVTGASRGIGAESAARLARIGYDVAITARTLAENEAHDHAGTSKPLRGSLEETAAAIRRQGREALCLRADILEPGTVVEAAHKALAHFGAVDLLFNNAIYQGPGNQDCVLEIRRDHLEAIYQGNVFTPLALIQTLLPGMLSQGRGTILNMVSYAAFHDPPAPAASGGWGFAYPSSKAAFARMAGSLRVEHADSGLRVFNLEPGTVITETMRAAGIDEQILERFKPCSPAAIAGAVTWLAENDPKPEWISEDALRGPAIARSLGELAAPSLLQSTL